MKLLHCFPFSFPAALLKDETFPGLEALYVKKNQCPYCFKVFRYPSDMKRHERMHTGERPYECSFCMKLFKRQDHYKSHLKKYHPGETEPESNTSVELTKEPDTMKLI